MYPTYRAPQTHDQRFPFLPFLAGLAVSPLLYGPRPFYGPFYGPRPFYGPFYGAPYGYPYGFPYGGYYR
ncbi:hypothetical protein JOC85_000333 [Bacillus mesophilus]|uniref:Penicillin-binding protein n=1 Tax=Bacillus mesophilus TaxID=1808955 RepID=A0A6M0Q2C7_9BACI|nr:penicillin-binding protein [Bacillus mesophilus]MBM7659566.1 hypothetical protein [Bacillus mesophilus]NEY70437.1 penicillin-binding protein [Bacillus mesophilus]